ncbi:MAG: DUF4160 domain-containing protein [Halioglobus sp.]|nr:DUF4160 domain-containing protein [Halioglobus sp.]
MSPTVYRERGFRFYFFSREEARRHVHVHCTEGEAKLWLEPEVALAKNYGLSDRQLAKIVEVTQEHCDEFVTAWDSFFGN